MTARYLPLLGLAAVALMPDFSRLMSTPTSDIHKPLPMPNGTFMGLIKSHTLTEINTPNDKENPKKPAVQFTVGYQSAMDDVDATELETAMAGKPLSEKTGQYNMWMTPDALYRIVEFAASLGIPTEGRTLGEIIPEFNGKPVFIAVVQQDSTRNKGERVSFIDKLVTTEEQTA